ncbi:MAG: CvpA family protein [Verrucomicrobiota bacterium]|nr:CvpA family protein [Verrucomicrobiota bacterium]
MKPDLVSGSPLWQAIFFSFALVLLLFQVARGWRLGIARQLVRLGALLGAYGVALYGGRALLPLLRPVFKMPDFVIAALGGALLAMIVYSLVNTAGAILFKRTAQQESAVVRLIYGISGAALGFLFGLFFLWLTIIGIRSLGAPAEAQVNASAPGRVPAFRERPLRAAAELARRTATNVPDENSLAVSLARLKKSIELGPFGRVVKQTDIIPSGIYETLAKMGEVFSRPESASRFLAYPGVAQLADNPKLLALRADPQIQRMLANGNLWELVQDDRLIEAANDPELAAQLKKFDVKKALDYAADGK